MPSNRGFTLIELMVAVSIIAVLSIIGFISYSNFLKNSRDAKRQADLRLIQSALEEFHADQLYYPFTVTVGSAISAGTKNYMTKVPSDPIATNPNYTYVPSGSGCTSGSHQNCTSYCLFAQMERAILTSDPGCTNPPSGFSSPGAFGVTKP